MVSYKYLIISCCSFFLLSLSCKNTESKTDLTETQEVSETQIITAKDIQSLKYTEFVLSNLSEKNILNWVKFQELDIQIELLKKANLSFFKDDKALLKGFISELKTEIPENLNDAPISVRLLAIETSFYKLHDDAIFDQDNKDQILSSIKEVLVAYSNLLLQINKKFEKEAQKIEKPF